MSDTNNDFYSMRKAKDVIEDAILRPLQHSNRTLYLEGAPGVGKTAMCHALYETHRRKIVTEDDDGKRLKEPRVVNPNGFTKFLAYVAPEREPTEWGLPMPNKERTAITMMPLDEFKFEADDKLFLLIDEIDKANNMMQNVLARIAHERQVHNVVLPKDSLVVMAGNRMSDRAGGFNANSHIKGRRTRIPVGVDHKEWIEDVAIPFALHSSVISYIRTSPGMLHKFDPNAPSFPSPRAWTKVGESLNDVKAVHVERALIEGDIGKEAANTFWGHLRIHRDLRSPEVIIKDPEGAAIPSGSNSTPIMWAEVTALARYADVRSADRIFQYFNRLPGEFAFCGYKDVLLREKALVAKSKQGQSWMVRNATLLASTKAA